MAKLLVGKKELDDGRFELVNNRGTFDVDHLAIEGTVMSFDMVEKHWRDPSFPYITILRGNVKSVGGIQLSIEEAKQLILDLGETIDKIEATEDKVKQATTSSPD